jgi:O-antigen/teichoic acid export membrane protein
VTVDPSSGPKPTDALQAQRTSLRSLGRNSLLYALGTFCQRAAGLLLIPLYTSALRVDEFGAFETLQVLIQILVIITNLGISNSLLRFYAECKNEAEIWTMIRTSILLALLASVCWLLMFLPFMKDLAGTLLKSRSSSLLVVLAFVWATGEALSQQFFAYYRARQAAGAYVCISVGVFLVLVGLTFVLVRIFGMGLMGALLGNLIMAWAVTIWLIIKSWIRGWTVSFEWARRLLRFGFPLIFSMSGWFIMNSSDRFFLAHYRDLAEVGIYSLGYRVGLIVQMAVVVPFQLAWGPFVFASAGKEQVARDFGRVFTYLVLAFSLLSAGVLLFSPEIVLLFGRGKFSESAYVIPFVLIAYAFNAVYYWSASLYHLTKKNIYLSAIVFFLAGLNLILNWIWIPRWGWVGAASATLVSMIGTGSLTFAIGRRLFPVPIEKVRLAKLGSVILPTLVAYFYLREVSSPVRWFCSLVLLALFPLTLYLIRFFDTSEIRMLMTLPALIKQQFGVSSGKTSC